MAEQQEWTHDTMIEALWRTPEKKELSILYERQDKSRYSGQAPEGFGRKNQGQACPWEISPESVQQNRGGTTGNGGKR